MDDDDEDFGDFNLFMLVCFGFDLINVVKWNLDFLSLLMKFFFFFFLGLVEDKCFEDEAFFFFFSGFIWTWGWIYEDYVEDEEKEGRKWRNVRKN